MESFRFERVASRAARGMRASALVGVVASGNLEVLLERKGPIDRCTVQVNTASHGFQPLWQAVIDDFVERRAAGGLHISINDGGARPDTVSLRLAQGVRLMEAHADDTAPAAPAQSLTWFEAGARQRVQALVDPDTFNEYVGPAERESSQHLGIFNLPSQFDDGIVIGSASIGGRSVLVAAQEGRFMGGAFGEVHGAKLTGLLRAAKAMRRDVVIAFDTGGVRLQEANAGELAIAEIMRALVQARESGIRVIGLVGGRAGCYGGGGLIAGCCSTLIVSEQGRISVSGPEVIETNKGVEEFDSRDRALVWRTMGGKHRYLIGGADAYAADDAHAFRTAVTAALERPVRLDLDVLRAEQARLDMRLKRFGDCFDARDIWQTLGLTNPDAIPDLPADAFLEQAASHRENAHDAR
jgi:malonate decarboxylase beta subunit